MFLCALALFAVMRWAGAGGVGDLLSKALPSTGGHPPRANATGTVTRVADGDTITVATPNGEMKVRLLGINAPEVAHPQEHKAGECYGDQATARMRQLVAGQTVTLTPDPTQADRDRYDRALRYVATTGVSDVGGTLVDEGLAREFHTKAGSTQRSDEYARRAATAQKAGRGLWSACRTS